jgi:hypothetical protein
MDTDRPHKHGRFAGMTINERLFTVGLFEAFDAAARARDRVEMCTVLEHVALSRLEAESVVESILSDPGKYGF